MAPATVSALMLYAWPPGSVPIVAITGMQVLVQQAPHDRRVDVGDVADEAEVDVARGGDDQPRIGPANADGQRAVHVDRGDDLRVDLTDEHHAGDVDGLGVGHPQSVAELGLLAEASHQLADLRSAAVHHHRVHADRVHQHDVLGEQGEGVGLRRPGERVAAVLHHDRLAGEAADVGQGLDQHTRLLRRRVGTDGRRDLDLGLLAHGYTPTAARPAVSSRPRATLAAWIAPPEAPLARLSMAQMATT